MKFTELPKLPKLPVNRNMKISSGTWKTPAALPPFFQSLARSRVGVLMASNVAQPFAERSYVRSQSMSESGRLKRHSWHGTLLSGDLVLAVVVYYSILQHGREGVNV